MFSDITPDPRLRHEQGASLLNAPVSQAPSPDSAVQIRPVRRSGGQVPTTSIEALSGVVSPAPRPGEQVQVRAYRDSSRPAPVLNAEEPVAPARPRSVRAQPPRVEPASPAATPPELTPPVSVPRTPARKAAPEPTPVVNEEAEAAPVSPRSGWLSSALNDWLKEPESQAAPAPRREQAVPREAPQEPGTRSQVIQAAPQEASPAPVPATDDRALPRTLQEALASDMLPNLPVELLERLWAQEEAAQEQEAGMEAVGEQQPRQEKPTPQQATRTPVHPSSVHPSSGHPSSGQPSPVQAAPVSMPAPMPEPTFPLRSMPEEAHAVVPTLQPMFPGAAPFLARFLPLSAPLQLGLSNRFCDLHAFLKYLHELSWYGYLHVSVGDLSTYALVYEGRVVAAAAVNATGEQALGELLSLYEQGATMATYPLPPTYAHVLSGVGSRAWKFDLTGDFTGLYVHPDGALFYSRGEVVAAMPAGLPYEGAFPAPLRPQTLVLPRSFAGWAHRLYVPTLRGRDANNPITSVYHGFREKYGPAGAQLIRALGEGQTPAEYAVKADVALHDLEPLLQGLTQGGYLKEQGKEL